MTACPSPTHGAAPVVVVAHPPMAAAGASLLPDGVYFDLPFGEYLREPRLSSSGIKDKADGALGAPNNVTVCDYEKWTVPLEESQ